MDPSAVLFGDPATPISKLQPYTVAVTAARDAEQALLAAQQAAAGQQTAAAAAAAQQTAAAAAAAAAAAEPTAASLEGPFAMRLHVDSPVPDQAAGEAGGGGAADARMEEAAEEEERGRGVCARHYWEESDPGRALSMLEDELSMVTGRDRRLGGQDEEEGEGQPHVLLALPCIVACTRALGASWAAPSPSARASFHTLPPCAGPAVQRTTALPAPRMRGARRCG